MEQKQKQAECVQEQGDCRGRRETKFAVHKTSEAPERHEERYRYEQEKDVQRRRNKNWRSIWTRLQEEMFSLQRTKTRLAHAETK